VLLDGRFDSFYKGVDTSKFAAAEEAAAAPGKKEAGAAAKVAGVSALQQSLRPGKLLLVGSSEITKFDYQGQRGGGDRPNAAFVQNILDYMNGNYGIPEMRSKGLEINPIRDDNALAMLIKKLFGLPMADAVDWAKIILKLLNIVLLPALIVGTTGASMMAWHRKKKKSIALEFSRKEDAK